MRWDGGERVHLYACVCVGVRVCVRAYEASTQVFILEAGNFRAVCGLELLSMRGQVEVKDYYRTILFSLQVKSTCTFWDAS